VNEVMKLELNNGVQMPALRLGVLQSEGGEATRAVSTASKSGYRLIDTAAAYFNEREVGQGIRDSGVDRAEVFLTTKLWMTDYGFDSALRAFDTCTAKLGVDHLDPYLLHLPRLPNSSRTIAAYKGAERPLSEGRVCAIGVANFKPGHVRAGDGEEGRARGEPASPAGAAPCDSPPSSMDMQRCPATSPL
jgi:2,5-diketo-D-gluconate reductase A